jgi:hypothetical protein
MLFTVLMSPGSRQLGRRSKTAMNGLICLVLGEVRAVQLCLSFPVAPNKHRNWPG